MHKLTSSPTHVALNAAPVEQKALIGRFEYSKVWPKSNSNIVARVANAALAIIQNVFKALFNAVVWAPNKIHSLFAPKAAQTAPVDSNVLSENQTVNVDYFDPETTEVKPESDVFDDELLEPVFEQAEWSTTQKALAIGGATLLAAGVVTGSAIAFNRLVFNDPSGTGILNRFDLAVSGTLSSIKEGVSTFVRTTVPTFANQTVSGLQTRMCSITGYGCQEPKS